MLFCTISPRSREVGSEEAEAEVIGAEFTARASGSSDDLRPNGLPRNWDRKPRNRK
jgi:hypothetical protein